jgi:hypothetical protein
MPSTNCASDKSRNRQRPFSYERTDSCRKTTKFSINTFQPRRDFEQPCSRVDFLSTRKLLDACVPHSTTSVAQSGNRIKPLLLTAADWFTSALGRVFSFCRSFSLRFVRCSTNCRLLSAGAAAAAGFRRFRTGASCVSQTSFARWVGHLRARQTTSRQAPSQVTFSWPSA